ncbi:MAG: hypothetical protein K2J82_11735 [Muribaculaceae bacterium]|nr:hypothetical protein [Muribaculaceae bacterium]
MRTRHNSSLIIKGSLLFLSLAAVLSVSIAFFSCTVDKPYRANLDNYVKAESTLIDKARVLNAGMSVYVDFSNGMNAAYNTPTSREALKSVVNIFTDAKDQASFFSLADEQITPLDMKQTEIYNAIMSPANYTKQKAPIEKTLQEIINKHQAALLITDFEEYNGGVIQQQNYAKTYFIDWLSQGYDIVFYKVDYKEGGKSKHLYFTVFDSPDNEFGNEVEKALASFVGNGMEKFVLGGICSSLRIHTSYKTSTQGGNYHSSDDVDIVSGVLENGNEESFCSYTLSCFNPHTEYYPFGVKWEDIPANIKATQEVGVPKEQQFTHLLSKIYVNFNLQDGYDIKEIAAKVYDFEPSMNEILLITDSLSNEGKEFELTQPLPDGKEVLDMFVATMAPAKNVVLPDGGKDWNEIFIDFTSQFLDKHTLPAAMTSSNDMLKLNVVIANAVPRLDAIESFFAWQGNNSLASSVENALKSDKVNPTGRVILTYYMKVL